MWFVSLIYADCFFLFVGKFYCKPHYCYRLSGLAQRKRPAPAPAPANPKVRFNIPLLLYINKQLKFIQMYFVLFIGAPDVSGNPQRSGRPRPNHKFSDPCGTPALRYPPFLYRPCPVPLSRSTGLPAFVAASNVLDSPPGGAQSFRFPFPPHLLHISSLLLYSQHPAQYSLAWTLQPMSRPGTSRPHMLWLPVMLCLLCVPWWCHND